MKGKDKARRAHWTESDDRSDWWHPLPEVSARPDTLRGGVDLQVTFPAPRDLREGIGVTLDPDQARALANQLFEAAEDIKP